jgi:hypothetical protein
MPSATQSTNLPADLERADRLKDRLAEFATRGDLKTEFEQQAKLFFDSSAPVDETELESLLDWFLFDWFDDNGEGVIDHFLTLNPKLTAKDRAFLDEWKDSINSVFEISSLSRNSLSLRELDTNDRFPVTTLTLVDLTPFERGQCIGARLLPLGDRFIFSGIQCIMPSREAAQDALEMRRRLEALSSPEALEKAQREQCTAFCEFFGCEELTIPSAELASTLGKFQHYLFAERRDPETGATRIEDFSNQFGQELEVPEMPPLPQELLGSGDVTILCDEFDGLVLLPAYNKFKSVFESASPETGWHELVWHYIKDPDIPIVAFERVAEKHPKRVEKVFRELLEDKSFSLEHLYAVLLHFKEPVEGLDDLKDDELLWDFFEGNQKPTKAATAARATKKAPARKTKAAPKAKAAASKKSTASRAVKKTAPKRAPASTVARKPEAKKAASKSRTTTRRKAAPARATARTRRSTSSRKR